MVGYPLEKYFKNMMSSIMIPKFPVTLDDIKNSNTIFVTNVLSLKVKMVRWKPKSVVSNYIIILK